MEYPGHKISLNENSYKTIHISDVPKGVTYSEIQEYYDERIGGMFQINIKR